LEAEKILETIERLSRRIDERFPGSGLRQVCRGLLEAGRDLRRRAEWVSRPQPLLRVAMGAALIAMLALLLAVGRVVRATELKLELGELLQLGDAALNVVIVFGAVVAFLFTLETRLKRSRALRALHELRSLAHVVDMHQLTKDPEITLEPPAPTPSSPERKFERFELGRYLDYCSEMLSLIAKLAALFVQRFSDPVVLGAAKDVEELTNGLARKIWQKIMILDRIQADISAASPAPCPTPAEPAAAPESATG
jgi:hypothetical protein